MKFDNVISVYDNFFDMGGNSIIAGNTNTNTNTMIPILMLIMIIIIGAIINDMRKTLNCKGLSVPDLFDCPTVDLMAKKVTTYSYQLILILVTNN